jgi:hypothetical protein
MTGGWDLNVKLKFCQLNINLVENIETIDAEYYMKNNNYKNSLFINSIYKFFHEYDSSNQIEDIY